MSTPRKGRGADGLECVCVHLAFSTTEWMNLCKQSTHKHLKACLCMQTMTRSMNTWTNEHAWNCILRRQNRTTGNEPIAPVSICVWLHCFSVLVSAVDLCLQWGCAKGTDCSRALSRSKKLDFLLPGKWKYIRTSGLIYISMSISTNSYIQPGSIVLRLLVVLAVWMCVCVCIRTHRKTALPLLRLKVCTDGSYGFKICNSARVCLCVCKLDKHAPSPKTLKTKAVAAMSTWTSKQSRSKAAQAETAQTMPVWRTQPISPPSFVRAFCQRIDTEYMYVSGYVPFPTNDPPQHSCELFVYNIMSPNVFSEFQKPSVFAVVTAVQTYWPLLLVKVCGLCKPPKTQSRIWFSVRASWKKTWALLN